MANPTHRDRCLADALMLTADASGTVYDRARPEGALTFAALTVTDPSRRGKLAHAFAEERAVSSLTHLVEAIALDGRREDLDEFLVEAGRQKLIGQLSVLQALIDPARGIALAGEQLAHLNLIMRQVCRVDIDGEAVGTGFLVRPDIVLTGYHVVRDLVEEVGGRRTGKAGSGAKLKLVFDDYHVFRDGRPTRMDGLVVTVSDDWLLVASPMHDCDRQSDDPEDPKILAEFLDFAAIRLGMVARVGIPAVTCRADYVPRLDEEITIFQHANRGALGVDRSTVCPVPNDWRFEHKVNTFGGSSGAPCFYRRHRVIGIHQAGQDPPPDNPKLRRNRAVSIAAVLPLLDAVPRIASAPAPLVELSEGERGWPVFGRLETQEWIYRQIVAEESRAPGRPILVVRGTAGSGKTFTHQILASVLPRVRHDVVLLSAISDVAPRTPEEFADTLLAALGYPPLPGEVAASEVNTERARHLSQVHLPALLAALESGRSRGDAPRGVWIVIDQIDETALGSATEIGNYLLAFYARTRLAPWLRFALLGVDGALPPEIVGAATIVNLDPRPSGDAVLAYLRSKLPTADVRLLRAIYAMAAADIDVLAPREQTAALVDKLMRGVRELL